MSQTLREKNKALLLEGFDVLFNKRDFALPRSTGRRTTSSTAHISIRAEMACSIY